MISPFAALKVRDREGCASLTSSLCVFSVHIFCHELHVLAEPGIVPFCVWVLKKNQKKLLYLLAVDISSGRRQIEVAILSVDSVYDLNLSRLLKKKKKKKNTFATVFSFSLSISLNDAITDRNVSLSYCGNQASVSTELTRLLEVLGNSPDACNFVELNW